MSNEISNERLERFIGGEHIPYPDAMTMAKELLHLRENKVIELPTPETWRNVDAVRAQSAYRVLVEKAIRAAGYEVKD